MFSKFDSGASCSHAFLSVFQTPSDLPSASFPSFPARLEGGTQQRVGMPLQLGQGVKHRPHENVLVASNVLSPEVPRKNPNAPKRLGSKASITWHFPKTRGPISSTQPWKRVPVFLNLQNSHVGVCGRFSRSISWAEITSEHLVFNG